MWTCSKCGERIEASFDVCWQCGTSREGVEDPSFQDAEAEVESRPDPPEPRPDEQAWQDVVTVATFRDLPAAHALRMRLEAEGVKSYLADSELIAMEWWLSNALGGVKVQVAWADLPRVREILAADAANATPSPEEEDQ